MSKPFLCKIGWHKWVYTSSKYSSRTEYRLALPTKTGSRECARCGKVQWEDRHCLGLNPPEYITSYCDHLPHKGVTVKSTITEDNAYKHAVKFSNHLRRELNLCMKDFDTLVDNMHNEQYILLTGGYKVVGECRYHPNGWVNILEVIPASLSSVGWSNYPDPKLGDGWYYKADGTCTVIVPRAVIREALLNKIKKKEYKAYGRDRI